MPLVIAEATGATSAAPDTAAATSTIGTNRTPAPYRVDYRTARSDHIQQIVDTEQHGLDAY